MGTWKQLTIRELLLLTVIFALGMLLFAKHRQLTAERAAKAALHARLDRQSAALPDVRIVEPRLTAETYRTTAGIATIAEAHLPERYVFKKQPTFKVELINASTMATVYEVPVQSRSTPDQRRFELAHTIDHQQTDLKPGVYAVRVNLLNDDEISVAHALSFVRLSGAP